MNYHIICSKCPPLADTCLQSLAVAFYSTLNGFLRQGNCGASLNSGTVFFSGSVAACDNTTALSPSVIIQ